MADILDAAATQQTNPADPTVAVPSESTPPPSTPSPVETPAVPVEPLIIAPPKVEPPKDADTQAHDAKPEEPPPVPPGPPLPKKGKKLPMGILAAVVLLLLAIIPVSAWVLSRRTGNVAELATRAACYDTCYSTTLQSCYDGTSAQPADQQATWRAGCPDGAKRLCEERCGSSGGGGGGGGGPEICNGNNTACPGQAVGSSCANGAGTCKKNGTAGGIQCGCVLGSCVADGQPKGNGSCCSGKATNGTCVSTSATPTPQNYNGCTTPGADCSTSTGTGKCQSTGSRDGGLYCQVTIQSVPTTTPSVGNSFCSGACTSALGTVGVNAGLLPGCVSVCQALGSCNTTPSDFMAKCTGTCSAAGGYLGSGPCNSICGSIAGSCPATTATPPGGNATTLFCSAACSTAVGGGGAALVSQCSNFCASTLARNCSTKDLYVTACKAECVTAFGAAFGGTVCSGLCDNFASRVSCTGGTGGTGTACAAPNSCVTDGACPTGRQTSGFCSDNPTTGKAQECCKSPTGCASGYQCTTDPAQSCYAKGGTQTSCSASSGTGRCCVPPTYSSITPTRPAGGITPGTTPTSLPPGTNQCQNGSQNRDQGYWLICECANGCSYKTDTTAGSGGSAWVCDQNCRRVPIGTRPSGSCTQIDWVHSGSSDYCGVAEVNCGGSCQTGAGGGGGNPTPTPTPGQKIAQCLRLKVYKGNVVTDPTTLKAGDAVVLAVRGDNATKGRIRVNGGAWSVSETKNNENEYTVPFTIPAGVTNFVIEAEVNREGTWK